MNEELDVYTEDLPDILDMYKQPLSVGDLVAKPAMSGRSAYIQVRRITEIVDGKIRLDGSNPFVQCPERLMKLKENYEMRKEFPWR